jgi:hypothetical protein
MPQIFHAVTKFVWNFPPAKTANRGNSPQNAGEKQELSLKGAPWLPG